MDDNNEVFIRLGELLFESKLEPGTVATAIELYGVHTWDRYGRRRLFLPDTAEANLALDVLAGHYAATQRDVGDDSESDWGFDYQFEGDVFGWPADSAPNFNELQKKIRTDPKPQRPLHAVGKSENANIGIIGGLLQYIRGELGNTKHPEFRSEDALIEHLEVKLKGYAGLSKRNLKDKFALGKAALKA